ncbi:MAG: cytochrome c [Deltaproteobacteria bacterium]|nr:cytochrome c [Deltaproteobacteria bacterium]
MSTRSSRSLLAIVSLVAILLAGCDSFPGRPSQAEYPLRPTDVTDFATLYRENCAGCHGLDGKFGAAVAMNNPVYLAIIDHPAMRRVIAEGVSGTAMPPFAQSAGGSLTDHQIDLLVAGIYQNWAGAGDSGAGAPPYSSTVSGNPDSGAQVYAASCQSCHGPDGKGGSVAGSVVDPSYLTLASNQYLRTIVIAGRPELGHPDWKHAASGQPLTAAQVSDVVAWLSSKRPAPLAAND